MRTRILTMLLSVVVTWSCLNFPLMAQDSHGAWRDWNNVLTLQAAQKVQVTQRREPKKVKGELVSVDAQGINVSTKHGQQRILREDVKELRAIKPGREKYGLAGALGILGGGATSLALTLRDARAVSAGRFPDERGVGSEILIGIAPAAAGAGLMILGGYKTVYQNPQP